MSEQGETPRRVTKAAGAQCQHTGAQTPASIVLLPQEIEALTGCADPSLQLKELRRHGFWRARLVPDGRRVVLERAHYEAVCQGRDVPPQSARSKPGPASKKVSLSEWASLRYDPPPGPRTLQRWARLGELSPAPVKVGRCYYINPNAVRVSEALAGGDGPSLVEQLEARE